MERRGRGGPLRSTTLSHSWATTRASGRQTARSRAAQGRVVCAARRGAGSRRLRFGVDSAHGKAGPVHTSFAPADCGTPGLHVRVAVHGADRGGVREGGPRALWPGASSRPHHGPAQRRRHERALPQRRGAAQALVGRDIPAARQRVDLTLLVNARGVRLAWAEKGRRR